MNRAKQLQMIIVKYLQKRSVKQLETTDLILLKIMSLQQLQIARIVADNECKIVAKKTSVKYL